MLKREMETIIMYNNNYVCSSIFKQGVRLFKALLLLYSCYRTCLFLEAHLETKWAFMVAEMVEHWRVHGHVSECTAGRLTVSLASRTGRLILVLFLLSHHVDLFSTLFWLIRGW